MSKIINVENLVGGYDNTVVLEDVSFSIEHSIITTILGGSGCGKTTLLKHLILLKNPMAGKIEILGQDINLLIANQKREFLKNIGVLFQNGALLNSISVAENVALPLQMHTNYSDKVIYDLVYMRLEQVGLANAFNLFPSELSGGMKKRVALARAIIMEPKIIFCDEPSAGLDPITARKLDDILLHLKEALNITLVVITHELESIKRISDKMIMLDKGKKIFEGNQKELSSAKHPMVREFFKLD